MAKSERKSQSIRLVSGSGKLWLVARRLPDDTGITFAQALDGEQHMQRGMTTPHPSFETAVSKLADLATEAEKIGWQRERTVIRGDHFSVLPAPPAAALKAPKVKK